VLRFLDLIRAYGLQDALRFDLSVIRGLAYYTGIVFEAFDAGRSLRALFGGGRYDDLMAALGGRPATGVGLGFGDVVVGELLAERGLLSAPAPATGVAVGFLGPEQHQTALLIAKTLRDRGQNVEVGLGPEKARRFFSRVGAAAHAQAIFIGPDDVAAGTVRVKNLADRSEQEMRIADLTASRPA
jgi:histidyl-tRNA synthetase